MDALWFGLGFGIAVGLPVFLALVGIALAEWIENKNGR